LEVFSEAGSIATTSYPALLRAAASSPEPATARNPGGSSTSGKYRDRVQVRDSQGVEPAAIQAVADLDGRRILEVGCGEGRLTRVAASLAREV
jgi:2-polyprenyl-3-methyl-5-hydroxy-6-metoxy-1,4-benzoquinol methylase